MQVLLVLSDVHMGVFFEPIPLFPVLAGYCIGVACQLGVPVQVQTVRFFTTVTMNNPSLHLFNPRLLVAI